MHITVNLDSDVMEAVRRYAEGRTLSLGKAVPSWCVREYARPSAGEK